MSSKIPSFRLAKTKDLLTSHVGLVLFGEFMNKVGMSNIIDKIFGKSGSNRGYKASTYIIPLLLKLHGGGRYLEDVRQIKEDGIPK